MVKLSIFEIRIRTEPASVNSRLPLIQIKTTEFGKAIALVIKAQKLTESLITHLS